MTDQLGRLRAALKGHYDILREVGSGGMATVYLAEDVKHGRQVALKVLRPELAEAWGGERFVREIGIAANLQHPNILPLHDSGEADGFLYYVMPYVEGESLRDRLSRGELFPIDMALRVLRDLAEALEYAHGRGVVHRDIKPDNVLLSARHAVVADFGIAKAASAATSAHALTSVGIALGTPAYMAPEQAGGQPDIDHRADIYAFGVVAYEIFAGRAPFSGPNAQALIAKHMTEAPIEVASFRPDLPDSVSALVMKCLEKDPARRLQHASEIIRTLDAVVDSGGMPVAVAKRGLKWPIGAVVLTMLAALTFWQTRSGDAPFLEPNLIVIAPFDVLATNEDLRVWSEGMVGLLARHFDGAGPLRSVSPNVVVRNWEGPASSGTAVELARRTGAGLAIFGSLYPSGSDSVRLVATLWDVAADRSITEAEWRDEAARVDRLADSVAVRFLSAQSGERQVIARTAPLGSQSPAAIKEFLRGEELFRRADYSGAIGVLENAVRLDSTFALAFSLLGLARGWQYSVDDQVGVQFAIKAGALNHGLPPRDSLLLLADSLRAAPTSWDYSSKVRLQLVVNDLLERYPNDPTVNMTVGDTRYHNLLDMGVTEEEILAPFAKAIALDPLAAPAYDHALELTFRLHGSQRALQYVRAVRSVANLPPRLDSIYALIETIVAGEYDTNALAERLQNTSLAVGDQVGRLTRFWRDSASTVLNLLFTIPGAMDPDEPFLGRSLGPLYRGQIRDALEAVRPEEVLRSPAIMESLIVFDMVPSDVRTQVEEIFFPGGFSNLRTLPPGVVGAWGSYLAMRGDSVALRSILNVAQAVPDDGSPDAFLARDVRERIGYMLGLVLGDTAQFIERFSSNPDSIRICTFCTATERLFRVRVFRAIGRVDVAQTMLSSGVFGYGVPAAEGLWALERARVAEALDDRETALDNYDFVATLWADADIELQPLVTEAKEALLRLTGEANRIR